MKNQLTEFPAACRYYATEDGAECFGVDAVEFGRGEQIELGETTGRFTEGWLA